MIGGERSTLHLFCMHLPHRIEGRPARLDPRAYPYLPTTIVKTTAAADYAALLRGRAA